MRSSLLVLAALLAVPLASLAPAAPADAAAGLPTPPGLVALVGDLHAHTAYSDGEGTPRAAFAAAKATGFLDFFAVTEHSEGFAVPFRLRESCLGPDALACHAPPPAGQTEWENVAREARAATDASFAAMRGFEWSSPVQGHANVLFSDAYADWITTGGATMDGFYLWLATQAGERAVATFNHPGREPGEFDGFRYRADVDARVAAIEAFNRGNDYSVEYAKALDLGWHAGAIGVTDGHSPADWTSVSKGRTVLLATERSEDAIREALLAMRTVATLGVGLDARFDVDGAPMGATIARHPADNVTATVRLHDATGRAFTKVEFVTPGPEYHAVSVSGPEVVATFEINVGDMRSTDLAERYLFARAWQGDRVVVVTSPVWIRADQQP